MRTAAWGFERLPIVLGWDDGTPVSLAAVGADAPPRDGLCPQPLVEVLTAGLGRRRATPRLSETAAGSRLRYVAHREHDAEGWRRLEVVQTDEDGGLTATTRLRSPAASAAVTVDVTLENRGAEPLVVEAVAVAALVGAPSPSRIVDLDLTLGRSDWLAESRWQTTPLRRHLVDLDVAANPSDPKGTLAVASAGSWSTGRSIPVGVLVDRTDERAWAWQIDTNGAWRWEVGERREGACLALSGPTQADHQWTRVLRPGERFTTVPVTLAVGRGLEGAIAELTGHRRASRAAHPDNAARPVIVNDYMNTLMGDPTTEKLLPLIDAAAEVGAEIFVIDAGWYDDGGAWWDSVGEWRASRRRFPGGLGEVIDRIRRAGMRPGLWLEPEVVGVRSPLAEDLPAEAFLRRHGVRVRETGRCHLDLRHPAARGHLDAVVDRLVEELGVAYLKLDYNLDAGSGTDVDADSTGDGLLQANRAHLGWLDGIRTRHPSLVLENCASGGMRADFALLSRLQLQSTSDQQSPALYPPIAACAPMHILPEQAASWAYPQPGMSVEEAAFTLVTSMLGRFYLSGHLDRMSDDQRSLVAQAVEAHKRVRAEIATATPFWPLGLPGWTDPWIALGLQTARGALLSLWRRAGADATVELLLPRWAGHEVDVEVLFPAAAEQWGLTWDARRGILAVRAGAAPLAARTLRIAPLG